MRRPDRLGPLLLLLGYGAAFAAAAFGGGVPAFDDHPGQFFRLWHALERSLPAGAWTADWNPDWWGGYPELQFYPPGFAMAGAALRLGGLWQPSVELVYRLLCALTLLWPAVTTYVLMTRVVEDRWLALPPAFLALTLSAGLRGGVEESLRWGMLTTRVAVGWLPLLLLALRPWLESGRAPVWAPLAGAAVVLSHPAGIPTVVGILLVATGALLVGHPRRPTLTTALAVSGLAFALTAFWTIPFIARQSWVVPLAWGELTVRGALGEVRSRPVVLAILLAAPFAWSAVVQRRRPFDGLLAILPVGLLGILIVDVGLFARGWSAVEPVRLLDGFVLAALLAAGLGVGVIATRLTPRQGWSRAVLALATVGLAAVVAGAGGEGPTGEPTLTLWPRADGWPTLERLEASHDLPRLWAALRGPPDRVLFLSSSLRLDRNPAWYAPHSHVTALAPALAGREIVHGTFTHPAPLAARFYTGALTPPPRLETLAEKLDGQRLLGRPWAELTPERFDEFARRLRIATVVVPTADVGRARFLPPSYERARQVSAFTVFERRDHPWPRIERITHRRYRILASPTGGVWIPTGIAAYPLWEAKSARGGLATRADPWGLLEVRLPLDVFEAELVYAEGWIEWSSLGVTLLGAAAWGAWAQQGRRPATGPPSPTRRAAREHRRRRRSLSG